MVDYLVKISEESYRILEEDFKDVFKAIDSLMEEQSFDDLQVKSLKKMTCSMARLTSCQVTQKWRTRKRQHLKQTKTAPL